jgi:hypothetical protein
MSIKWFGFVLEPIQNMMTTPTKFKMEIKPIKQNKITIKPLKDWNLF